LSELTIKKRKTPYNNFSEKGREKEAIHKKCKTNRSLRMNTSQ
jgi:hypothetical protein